MKFKLLKLALVLSSVYATTVYAQNDTATVPQSGGYNPMNSVHGWHINASALWERFSNNGTNYAEVLAFPPNREISNYENISTGNHFGWSAGIGYYIDWMDSDISFNYFTLNTSDHDHVSGPIVQLLSPVNVVIGTGTEASGTTRFNYTSAALTGGHLLRLSPFFDLYYYGGLDYTHFSKNMSVYEAGGTEKYDVKFGTSYNAWGPTFGIDGECYPFYYYELPNFSISGGVQASLLYGTRKEYFRAKEVNFTTIDNFPTTNIVVPTVGGDLAVNYLFQMSAWSLKTSIGYQAVELFGVSTDYRDSDVNASFQGLVVNFTVRF